MSTVKAYYDEIAPHIAQAKRIITMIEANALRIECDSTAIQANASLFCIHRQAKQLKEALKAINAICNRYGGRIANLCKDKTACKSNAISKETTQWS